ncbi:MULTISPECIES: RNA polymerase sigma factor [Paenibacillus]|uniref:RNA polymerase subunit sigma n=1 Tax=Paenibacillus campinasensis TaxID=66347 RepID=A0A268F0J0_9BACL|nr:MULTISPECIES: RNA polymerase sigma factor [Paenibacillus]MUG65573.1 sigma-70 family RNA polymerase sigma factor [Paenibacillus campinasensis]PAD78899.1 RNA polymerase subunit sigma [Paenibacillus campinasensis]PAK53875.1 RNA polymerase subunit sigma [Paenibacillus sp. 7541]
MHPVIPGEAMDKNQKIEWLIERVKAGDKEAYAPIIRQFERQMYTYCYYILRNHEETEDAVQEIFIRAYTNLHQYSNQVSFSAWLYKVAYHHLINIKKKQGRIVKLIERCQEQHTVQDISPHQSAVEELLTYLTAEERHILLLKSVEEYHFEEIAEVMGIKPATLRKKYERIRKKLMAKAKEKGVLAHGTFAESHGIR